MATNCAYKSHININHTMNKHVAAGVAHDGHKLGLQVTHCNNIINIKHTMIMLKGYLFNWSFLHVSVLDYYVCLLTYFINKHDAAAIA